MRASIHEQLLCSRQVLSYNTFLLQSISLNHTYRRKDFMAVYLCIMWALQNAPSWMFCPCSVTSLYTPDACETFQCLGDWLLKHNSHVHTAEQYIQVLVIYIHIYAFYNWTDTRTFSGLIFNTISWEFVTILHLYEVVANHWWLGFLHLAFFSKKSNK